MADLLTETDEPVPACPKCKSTDIQSDATAEWSTTERTWVLLSVQDNCECQCCGWSGNSPLWLK